MLSHEAGRRLTSHRENDSLKTRARQPPNSCQLWSDEHQALQILIVKTKIQKHGLGTQSKPSRVGSRNKMAICHPHKKWCKSPNHRTFSGSSFCCELLGFFSALQQVNRRAKPLWESRFSPPRFQNNAPVKNLIAGVSWVGAFRRIGTEESRLSPESCHERFVTRVEFIWNPLVNKGPQQTPSKAIATLESRINKIPQRREFSFRWFSWGDSLLCSST